MLYDDQNASGYLRQINEAIHRLAGHSRDLSRQEEIFTESRAAGIGEQLVLLYPDAIAGILSSQFRSSTAFCFGACRVDTTVLEPEEALQTIEADDNIAHVAARIQRFASFLPCRCGGFGFPLVLAARKLPVERIFELAALVVSGVAQDGRSPNYRLHQKLGDMRARRQRIDQLDLAAVTIKA